MRNKNTSGSAPGHDSVGNYSHMEAIVGITLTCDIIRSITGNAGVQEWHIGICGYKQGRLKWHIGITRRRIKELEFADEMRRNKAVEP